MARCFLRVFRYFCQLYLSFFGILTFFNQAKIKLDALFYGLKGNALVIAVNGGALLVCQCHGREAIDLVRDKTPMLRVRASKHKIGRHYGVVSGGKHRGGYSVPWLAPWLS